MGGDTMWCNQYIAYERLSDGLKKMLHGVRARFCGARLALTHGHQGDIPEQFHPVVRTHPETGRKALFVGHPDTCTNFEDMSVAESRPLLDFLYQHCIRPEFTCRFRWAEGSLAIWDNRCTLHYAINDYDGQRRLLHRTAIAGERPIAG